MQKSQIFTELIEWQKAHKFVLLVYKLTSSFPQNEIYELTSQFRRAAVSIPAIIAEGFKKRGLKDKLNFLNVAQGSFEECRYYLILSEDLNYGNTDILNNQIIEVSKLLTKYSGSIRNSVN